MYLDNMLNGRKERRLPILVAVWLTPRKSANGDERERTFTDNLSAHGVRVRSTRAWQAGEQAEITPVKGEPPARGEAVYCQKLDDERYCVGFKLVQERLPWSVLQRFDGV
jgi:hypothetical protein